MTGLEKIKKERDEQINKHGRTVALDAEHNYEKQLSWAASCLAFPEIEDWDARHAPPPNWDLKIWQKMHDKPYEERLVIAGALIAAELDRISFNK